MLTPLSPRQIEVLELLAAGHTYVAISRQTYISPRTVHAHLKAAYARLGASGAANAVHLAHRAGVLGAVPVVPVVPTLPGRPGPNETLPCGTDSARRRHLAHGHNCAVCGVPS